MNTLIIFQADENVSNRLTSHGLDLSGNVSQMHGFQVMAFEMAVTRSPKGPIFGDAHGIYRAIVKFCDETLAAVHDDVVEVQIVFMFHQTNSTAARNIVNGCRLIEWTRVLQDLADRANKHLKVVNVVLLSCESAADLVVQPPVWRGHRAAVDQAQDMRNAAKAAFRTRMAPPYPSQGTYHPTIVTYSTGDVDRGGVVLDPFHVSFTDLDGRFDEHGDWQWNDPDNHDSDGVPTSGTIHFDNEETGQTTAQLDSGRQTNLMGFHP
jgi:hypothetical protein